MAGADNLKPFPKGVSGNPGGKPRSRKALEKEFIDDLLESWRKAGKSAIERLIAKRPGDYVRVVAGLVPKQIDVNDTGSLDRERASKLLELVTQRLEELAGSSGEPARDDSGAEQAPRLSPLQ
jgi:hypothetical protein